MAEVERATAALATAVGIDLAWSPRNLSGVAVAEVFEDQISVRELSLDRELTGIQAMFGSRTPPVTIAIDAPTIVPNASGMRPAERELMRRFGARGAGPYPANRTLLGRPNGGRPRGEELVASLQAKFGAIEVGIPPVRHHGVFVMEVFPAPALVTLFQLASSLRYKKKPTRTWDGCRAELSRYVELLQSLRRPQLILPEDLRVTNESGRVYKALEDRVDAILCAYLAGLAWLFGSERLEMVGSLKEGYIVLPRPL